MTIKRLTIQENWDDVWDDITLPLVYEKKPTSPCISTILGLFDKYLPRVPDLSILEIGGSVGGYLAYMHKTFGYQVCCLDYSQVGCTKTRENFRLLDIKGEVIQGDLFSDVLMDQSFDIVYSMGFVEHFSELDSVVEKHLALLKPGGILMMGVPNFLGINHWLMRMLAPQRLSQHELSTMEISNWIHFEQKFGLKKLFRGYIGGFIPTAHRPLEIFTPARRIIDKILGFSSSIMSRYFPWLRKFNARFISCYALGIWEKP